MVVASYEVRPDAPLETHEHDVHQLTVTSAGVLSVGVNDRVWILPRSLALWIPAHTQHSVASSNESMLTTLWFDPACCPIAWPRVTPVCADPLLMALATRLDDSELTAESRARTEAVLFDVIRPSPRDVVSLPDPIDDRARRITDALRADPRTIEHSKHGDTKSARVPEHSRARSSARPDSRFTNGERERASQPRSPGSPRANRPPSWRVQSVTRRPARSARHSGGRSALRPRATSGAARRERREIETAASKRDHLRAHRVR